MSVEVRSVIASALSFNSMNRPSVQMMINCTETLITVLLRENASKNVEAESLVTDLNNRYQFMLWQRSQGAI